MALSSSWEVVFLSDPILFGEYAERWLAQVAPLRLKPTAVAEYASLLHRHIIPALGDRPLAELSADEIQAYLLERVESGLSAGSARNHLAVLRAVFKAGVGLGVTGVNVAAHVMPPRLYRTEQRFPSPQEMRAILAACPRAWLLLLALPIYSASRKGEALALRWPQVSIDRHLIAFTRSLRGGVEYTVKSAASRASVTMADELVPLFVERQERVPDPAAGYVFCDKSGAPLGDGVPNRVLRKACVRAGVEPFTYHQLRHGSIAALIATGAHPRVVQEFARHADFDTTMTEYGHLIGSAGGDAVRDLSRLISGS